jgi:hypothetical protein
MSDRTKLTPNVALCPGLSTPILHGNEVAVFRGENEPSHGERHFAWAWAEYNLVRGTGGTILLLLHHVNARVQFREASRGECLGFKRPNDRWEQSIWEVV